ncbi:dolichyl-diphosphooligosaccharide--protein glycosyltransferase subunit 2-like [Stylonychia lemnae]|uniref:Dolichyl-diphosphooligosaccharide--protein glycosyltransferase subunit 2-like n=1 Tax=Stylonychia lemnae TaxID=5949 RepID=A0A078AHK7_STYLE|nr:dolichyl-diphosphooligosaccharide--protein glycosyltransferase subunit 2-like [Stylonychia lemnae]|eukprot:CDW80313.1 dolichyl-diphosphooligosaccharide--protein glycosyltransferase subunit 2-like [Stylonychia lemnae]
MSYFLQKFCIVSLLLGVSLFSLSNAHLSHQNKEALRQLANDQIKQVLSGSFTNLSRDVRVLAEASQALEILGKAGNNGNVCKGLNKVQQKLTQSSADPELLYHLAEINRIYSCDFLSTHSLAIQNYLSGNNAGTSVSELYFGHLLNTDSQKYGFTASEAYNKNVLSTLKKEVSKNFNNNNWAYKGADGKIEGVSVNSIRAVDLLSQQTEYLATLDASFLKLQKQAVTQATSDNEQQYYVLSSTARYQQDVYTNEDLNLAFVRLGQTFLKPEEKRGLRNYFLMRSKGASSAHQLLVSLRGLKTLSDVPNIEHDGEPRISLSSKSQQLKFNILDNFGTPFQGVKTIKVILEQIDEKQSPRDVPSKANADNNQVTVSLQEDKVGKFRVVVELDGLRYNKIITLVDRIQLNTVYWKITQSKTFPDALENSIIHPKQFPNDIKNAQDGNFLHVGVSALFQQSEGGNPQQIYLRLQKKGAADHLSYQAYAKLNVKTGLYHLTFDFTKGMEHLNGEYQVELHASDFRAQRNEVWDLGTLNVWFKQGLEEGNNLGLKDIYQPDKVIVHIFPEIQPERSLFLPLIGLSLITAVFGQYVLYLLGNKANLSKLTFTGTLFILTILLILLIFTAFWIEVKLIPTLWLLLFISPVVFLICQRGLIQADCTIPEYRAQIQGSKKRLE